MAFISKLSIENRLKQNIQSNSEVYSAHQWLVELHSKNKGQTYAFSNTLELPFWTLEQIWTHLTFYAFKCVEMAKRCLNALKLRSFDTAFRVYDEIRTCIKHRMTKSNYTVTGLDDSRIHLFKLQLAAYWQNQGWRLLKLRSLICQGFFGLKDRSDPFNYIHSWLVSPQLSCVDTSQVWMRYSIIKYAFSEKMEKMNYRKVA